LPAQSPAWEVIGRASRETYSALAGLKTVRELSEIRSRDASTIRKHLKRLVAWGLVQPIGDGFARLSLTPNQVAALERHIGVAERPQRRKDIHRNERFNFKYEIRDGQVLVKRGKDKGRVAEQLEVRGSWVADNETGEVVYADIPSLPNLNRMPPALPLSDEIAEVAA
jgi:hypothetical protein